MWCVRLALAVRIPSMMFHRSIGCLAIYGVLLTIAGVHGAPGPTTRVVETPEMGLRAYNYAMHKIDEAGMQRRVFAPTPALKQLAGALTYSDGQVAAVMAAAQKKFANDASKTVGQAFNDVSDADMVGGQAQLDKTGERGIFISPNGGSIPVCLDEGKWKMDARRLVGAEIDEIIEASVRIHRARGDFAKSLANAIDAGEFVDVEQVVIRIQTRIEQ